MGQVVEMSFIEMIRKMFPTPLPPSDEPIDSGGLWVCDVRIPESVTLLASFPKKRGSRPCILMNKITRSTIFFCYVIFLLKLHGMP